jgi:hypothetical protein
VLAIAKVSWLSLRSHVLAGTTPAGFAIELWTGDRSRLRSYLLAETRQGRLGGKAYNTEVKFICQRVRGIIPGSLSQ